MAVAMVVNGRLFKVAATLCGLTLTIYAIYVYREVTSEFQQCEKDVSATLQQYKSAQSVITDLEGDARQARSASSACQNSYAKLLEESVKKKADAEQSIKRLTGALDIERKTKEALMAEQDQRTSKCTSENQSLRLQLDMAQKKCSEDKNEMQNRLYEVISHSDIVDKQQQICSDDKNKLTNEKATLKAQNDDLMSKLKGLQQQVKTLLDKAKVQFDAKRGGSTLNKSPQSEQRVPNPTPPLPNKDVYSVRKTVDLVRPVGRFTPLGIDVTTKPEGNQKPTPITLPTVQALDDDEDKVNEKQPEGVATEKAESELSKRENQPDQHESKDLDGGGGAKQAGGLVAGPVEGGVGQVEGGAGPNEKDEVSKKEGNEEEAEDPDRPHQFKDEMDDGVVVLQQDLKGGALEAKSKAAIDRNDQS